MRRKPHYPPQSPARPGFAHSRCTRIGSSSVQTLTSSATASRWVIRASVALGLLLLGNSCGSTEGPDEPPSPIGQSPTLASPGEPAEATDSTTVDVHAVAPATSRETATLSSGETAPPEPSAEARLPPNIRRLSNQELGNSIRSLLGTDERYETSLPADVRQGNFTVNEAQVASSDWTLALDRIARAAAAGVANDLDTLSPCPGETTDTCASTFIRSLATKAFRREPQPVELDELQIIYAHGAAEDGFARGMEHTIATILQSPSFIYVTALGNEQPTLTADEVASQLAYVTTRQPPDEPLIQAAQTGALADAGERGAHTRRLLNTEAGRLTLQEMLVQWFATDRVLDVSKDDIPEFDIQREGFLRESRDLARAVIDSYDSDITKLLTADFTIVSPSIASYYGLNGEGRVSLEGTPRLGLLTQAAFLSGHSSPNASSPVRRGATFMRQVLCTDPPDPSQGDLVVAPPSPDPSLSTRQLFAAHASDPQCQGCHALIDPIGFAFEQFDEGGRLRRGPPDNNGHPVDASGSVTVSGETFVFDDAKEFLTQVAASSLAQRCIAKMTARYAFASRVPAVEEAFVGIWQELDATERTRLDEVLIKLTESELFVQRSTP